VAYGFLGHVLLASALLQLFEPSFLLMVTTELLGRLNPEAAAADRCILINYPFVWGYLRGKQINSEMRELSFYCILSLSPVASWYNFGTKIVPTF